MDVRVASALLDIGGMSVYFCVDMFVSEVGRSTFCMLVSHIPIAQCCYVIGTCHVVSVY